MLLLQTIMEAAENVVKILHKAKTSSSGYRWMTYVVECPVAEGVLLFHTLTRELLLLSQDEYQHFNESQALKDKWFVVPVDMEDIKYADHLRFILEAIAPKKKHITSYTIFTTTDCNARCFYCYEMGRSKVSMNVETAHKVSAYIAEHCGGEKVKLHWFGGEPLYNMRVIDIICSDLLDLNVEYTSSMISNGYLFDNAVIKRAVDLWKLRKVQITLDGTEEVYNKVKNFIYKNECNPYQIVLSNIDRLLDFGVQVSIRLNLGKHNEDDLLHLADDLHARFASKEGLSVYSHVLFEVTDCEADFNTKEERQSLYFKQQRLMKHLTTLGLTKGTLSRQLRLNHCMADSEGSLTILPGGELGLCEHFSENNFVGHIDNSEINNDVVKLFRERIGKIDKCIDCFYYPECIRLKMCQCNQDCFEEIRENHRQSILRGILFTYKNWCQKKI